MAVLAAAICASGTASVDAAGMGGYFGVGIGRARAPDLPSSACSLLPASYYACSVDDAQTSTKIFGGYQFNPYIAAEGTYSYFGNFEGRALSTASVYPAKFRFEASGLSFDAVGSLPITRNFSLLGRAGATIWSAIDIYDDYKSGVSADYGLGLEYDFVRPFGLRAEYVEYNGVGKSDIGKSNIDVASLSAIFRF